MKDIGHSSPPVLNIDFSPMRQEKRLKFLRSNIASMERCGWVSQVYILPTMIMNGACLKLTVKKLFEIICWKAAGWNYRGSPSSKRETIAHAFISSIGESCRNAPGRGCRKTGTGRRIIRHRGKIQAIIGNARAYLQWNRTANRLPTLSWSFVNHQPQVTETTTLSEIPTSTPASDAPSKALKNVVLSLSVPQSVTPLYAGMWAGE